MSIRRLILILTVTIVCIAADQATKAVAKHYFADGSTVVLLGDSVRLGLAKNYGTFLGLGESLPEGIRNAATTIGVGIILTILFGYALLAKESNSVATAALAMLVGGGLSNLIDRIVYGGYVVDFMNVGIGSLRTGIFNVADMFIMLGVALLLFSDLIRRRLERRNGAQ